MVEPISAVAGGFAISQTGWSLLGVLLDHIRDADVIAALFDADANRVDGDSRISVRTAVTSNDEELNAKAFWYLPIPVAGFEFVAYATNPYWEVRVDHLNGPPYAPLWRWVQPAIPGPIYADRSNVANIRTNFLVIGYKPSAIVRHILRVHATP